MEDTEEGRPETALVLERTAKFAGIAYSDNDLALAVDRGSFEAMRRNEEEHGAESYTAAQRKRGQFVRRGQVDGWKNELDPQLIARIEHEFAPAMKVAGYL